MAKARKRKTSVKSKKRVIKKENTGIQIGNIISFVVFISVAVFILLSDLGFCGPFGEMITNIILNIFGTLGHQFFFVVLVIAFMSLYSVGLQKIRIFIIMLLYVSIISFVSSYINNIDMNNDLILVLTKAQENAINYNSFDVHYFSAGLISTFINYYLLKYMNTAGSMVIHSFLAIICFLIAFGITGLKVVKSIIEHTILLIPNLIKKNEERKIRDSKINYENQKKLEEIINRHKNKQKKETFVSNISDDEWKEMGIDLEYNNYNQHNYNEQDYEETKSNKLIQMDEDLNKVKIIDKEKLAYDTARTNVDTENIRSRFFRLEDTKTANITNKDEQKEILLNQLKDKSINQILQDDKNLSSSDFFYNIKKETDIEEDNKNLNENSDNIENITNNNDNNKQKEEEQTEEQETTIIDTKNNNDLIYDEYTNKSKDIDMSGKVVSDEKTDQKIIHSNIENIIITDTNNEEVEEEKAEKAEKDKEEEVINEDNSKDEIESNNDNANYVEEDNEEYDDEYADEEIEDIENEENTEEESVEDDDNEYDMEEDNENEEGEEIEKENDDETIDEENSYEEEVEDNEDDNIEEQDNEYEKDYNKEEEQITDNNNKEINADEYKQIDEEGIGEDRNNIRDVNDEEKLSVDNDFNKKLDEITEDKTAKEINEAVERTKKKISRSRAKKKYKFPPLYLLKKSEKHKINNREELKETAQILQSALAQFGVGAKVTHVTVGPTVTRYELLPSQGVRVKKFIELQDDIKLAMAATDIRIEAPIPGKSAVGIEVPNKVIRPVLLGDLISSSDFRNSESKVSTCIGRDIAGKNMICDISQLPHLLVAGATGSGKSVCINSIIMSIIYKATPEDVRLILVDPKVVELQVYNDIPHLLVPVVTDPKRAAASLNWAVNEMMRRYNLIVKEHVRNIEDYNKKAEEYNKLLDEELDQQGQEKTNENIENENKEQTNEEPKERMEHLPKIVIIIDEFSDLMMVASKDVENAIFRIAQLARACGIYLIIATQRPSVNVISGSIKANVPGRIAFAVSSGIDSKTIIDQYGAEKLIGKGDMLYYPTGMPKPVRVQGCFVSDEEVRRVVKFIKDPNITYDEEIDKQITEHANFDNDENKEKEENNLDEYFVEAGKLIIQSKIASSGFLQRKLQIGFNRASRILDQLADNKVVTEQDGKKPREILMEMDEFLNTFDV